MSDYKHAWNKWKNSLSREIEDIKKNQMEILYMKNTINKMNISVKALNSKMEVTEEQIYKKDDRAIETVQSDQQTKYRLEKKWTESQGVVVL